MIALGLASGAIPAAASSTIPGADNRAFREALALWLDDDESTALPALSDLAIGGNVAARLLLAQIDKTPALQGPYLSLQPRAARIALLRAPGGMSGASWMSQIDDVPLVDAWRALHWPDTEAGIIRQFEQMGEHRAARQALTVLAARENDGLRTLDPAETEAEQLYLLWRNADPERRTAIAALVPATHPQRLMMGETVPDDALDQWLADSDAARPLTELCQSICPDEIASCQRAAYGALASHDALLTLGSPAEALVSQADFLHSARGQATVLRRILLSSSLRVRRQMLDRLDASSACFATALAEEAERFRRIQPAMRP